MIEVYSFLFCIGLGVVARVLFLGTSALLKRTDLMPVTIIVDALYVIAIGAAFTVYIIMTGAVIAPYMFAALLSGYLFTYFLTRIKKKSR